MGNQVIKFKQHNNSAHYEKFSGQWWLVAEYKVNPSFAFANQQYIYHANKHCYEVISKYYDENAYYLYSQQALIKLKADNYHHIFLPNDAPANPAKFSLHDSFVIEWTDYDAYAIVSNRINNSSADYLAILARDKFPPYDDLIPLSKNIASHGYQLNKLILMMGAFSKNNLYGHGDVDFDIRAFEGRWYHIAKYIDGKKLALNTNAQIIQSDYTYDYIEQLLDIQKIICKSSANLPLVSTAKNVDSANYYSKRIEQFQAKYIASGQFQLMPCIKLPTSGTPYTIYWTDYKNLAVICTGRYNFITENTFPLEQATSNSAAIWLLSRSKDITVDAQLFLYNIVSSIQLDK